ncbi:hypothetical protein BpHYR1_009877 [Brachionus plicatilis]|uniref:Uncharacterized protein n=1 Tax=Brachionus plicatilis TaxID=10195 RepID=A0A3M7RJF1_BRAPC|nr:hypothetical protein BpHYR1_009877 [Brachionus plicatilis]
MLYLHLRSMRVSFLVLLFAAVIALARAFDAIIAAVFQVSICQAIRVTAAHYAHCLGTLGHCFVQNFNRHLGCA